jgi:prepilin-type N-terminal cleavage/methylation domain-containing protein
MTEKPHIRNQKGFTLIELLSVMVIMGVMISVGLKKFDYISHTAAGQVLAGAIRELKTRETLAWTKIKLSETGWSNDGDVFAQLDTNLGPDYTWPDGIDASGGDLRYKSRLITLTRSPSSKSSMGNWN